MDEVVPCSFGPANVVELVYVLVLAADCHTALMSNVAVVEQAHLDEADAQSDTGFGASLIFQAVALEPGFWVHLMIGRFAEAVEVLKDLRCFQSAALRHGLHVPSFQRCHHFRRCEDQCEGFLILPGLATFLVSFHLAFAESVENGVVAVQLVVLVGFVA